DSEALWRFLERDQSRGRENSHLAHAAAETFAIEASAFNEVRGTRDDRSNRSAQRLRQAEHHGVGFGGDLANRLPGGGGSVEYARAIHMDGYARIMRPVADIVDDVLRVDAPAGHVVRILDLNGAGAGR